MRRPRRLPHRSHRRILALFRFWDDSHAPLFAGAREKFTLAEIFRDHLREVRLLADLDSMNSSPHVMHRLNAITQSWQLLSLFLREGGRQEDLDKLKLRAICGDGALRDFGRLILGYEADTIGAEVGDITTELLTDTIQLTHPDRHPAERRDLAHRVTEELLRLRPFTFLAPTKPDPPPVVPPDTRDGSEVVSPVDTKEPSRSTYRCETCADTIAYFYCDECRREWEMRQRKEEERDNAKRRAQYARRRDRRRRWMRPVPCLGCAAAITSRRKDARYCSHACRQRAYRGRGALEAVR